MYREVWCLGVLPTAESLKKIYFNLFVRSLDEIEDIGEKILWHISFNNVRIWKLFNNVNRGSANCLTMWPEDLQIV